jgi:hypothetical protein
MLKIIMYHVLSQGLAYGHDVFTVKCRCRLRATASADVVESGDAGSPRLRPFIGGCKNGNFWKARTTSP